MPSLASLFWLDGCPSFSTIACDSMARRWTMNETQANPSEELLKRLCYRAGASVGWMKLLGILSIVQGVFAIFTIWGILVCWLPIWIGLILYRAAGDAEMASKGAPQSLESFLQRINRYFLIQGVLTLIGIIVAIIMVMVLGFAFFAHLGRYM
jgi:small-conductance mechanosensitive channel